MAIQTNQLEKVKKLLKKGIDIKMLANTTCRLLDEVVRLKNTVFVKLFLNIGTDKILTNPA